MSPEVAPTTQIVPLICSRMVTSLTATLVTNVEDSDPTIAHVVQFGRYRDEPVRNNIQVAIIGGDPDDPNYRDGVVTLDEMHKVGYRFPAGEVGGGRFWWRRGVVQLGCYFIREKFAQTVAAGHAYNVLGRIEEAIPRINVADLSDSFGEEAYKLFCYGNTFSESGGPPGSYIWRGKIFWACLTNKS